MQANWSLILNVLLLIGVMVTIGRLMKARRQSLIAERYQSQPSGRDERQETSYNDDIIAVRKINSAEPVLDNGIPPFTKSQVQPSPQPRLMPHDDDDQIILRTNNAATPRIYTDLEEEKNSAEGPTLMFFLLAKENRQFAGYELLQTVLAAGLRFGEGGLFHRHKLTNGEGPIICSLAAATPTGVFDLQNIGAFSVRGLCLYMRATNHAETDAERFTMMLDTARQLSDGLDAHLLDDQRLPLSEERIARYHHLLQLNHSHFEFA